MHKDCSAWSGHCRQNSTCQIQFTWTVCCYDLEQSLPKIVNASSDKQEQEKNKQTGPTQMERCVGTLTSTGVLLDKFFNVVKPLCTLEDQRQSMRRFVVSNRGEKKQRRRTIL